MACDFYQAAVPDGWQILGEKLRPFSLGHFILLKRHECAFISGGVPSVLDLLIAVMICSRSWEDAQRFVEGNDFKPEGKRLEKILKKCDNIPKRMIYFGDYIEEGMQGPKVWSKDDNNAPKFGSPFAQVIKVSMMSKMGLTESEALNRPLSLCLWDMATLSELQGLVSVHSEEDDEAKTQAEELQRKIDAGEIDLDELMKN